MIVVLVLMEREQASQDNTQHSICPGRSTPVNAEPLGLGAPAAAVDSSRSSDSKEAHKGQLDPLYFTTRR